MNVEFEDTKFTPRNFGEKPVPKLAAWLIAKGIAKDEAGANKVQIVVAVIFLAVSLFLFFK